ncbi:hypothetical protein Patl1_00266 [Pistacia atlantica]|uniref:Uncharacterized protein n=1 Tax=Pistacia atlantica TaxID=434234 RepID=A0ACC1C9M6_9ROSI|nr:hypothetical protein Patl1_00266 [Pistacia atlantica]
MLPYLNLQDAEAGLGRELSFAEKIWFNYSANKHDFVLHSHNIIFLCFFYSLVPLPYMLVELSRSKKIMKYKVQPKVQRSFWDMFKCYKDVMKSFLIVVGPLQLLSYPTINLIGIRTGLPLPSLWELLLQLGVYFLVEDYVGYWVHRWLHTKWGYENIHHVHHEYRAPIGFSAPYAHWSEILILGFPAFLGPALIPGHIITYWLWFILRQMEAIDTHSGYEFPWTKYFPFYAGAKFHDYHHYVGRRSQSNFSSVFTYCDYLYGTDKGYRCYMVLANKVLLNSVGD